MNSEWLKSGVPTAHLNGRQRVEGKVDIQRLFRAIDSDPAIVGAGVVYIESDFTVVTLREFQPLCSVAPTKIVLREAPKYMAAQEFVRVLETQPRESQLAMEAMNTALSCTSAAIGWIVLFSGTIAVPFSAGASSVIIVLGYSAAIASSAQCLIGRRRMNNELYDPAANHHMDGHEWFREMTLALDAVSLLGVGISLLSTVKLVNVLKTTTGKSVRDVLKGLTRQERAKLTKELLSINDPRLTSKLIKLRQVSGELPKRFTSAEFRYATITQIKDVLGASTGLAGSAYSGNMRTIALGLYVEGDE